MNSSIGFRGPSRHGKREPGEELAGRLEGKKLRLDMNAQIPILILNPRPIKPLSTHIHICRLIGPQVDDAFSARWIDKLNPYESLRGT